MERSSRGNVLRVVLVACYAGVVLDAIATLQLLFPSLPTATWMPADATRGPAAFGLRCAAALMAGWTGLLLWAMRAPIERRGVLALTVIPVIAGLVANEVYAVASGAVPVRAMALTWVVQTCVIVLFSVAYLKARREANEGPRT